MGKISAFTLDFPEENKKHIGSQLGVDSVVGFSAKNKCYVQAWVG